MADIQDIWLHAQNMIRSARQIINSDLRPLNLSSAEGNILLHLWIHGQDMWQDHISEQLDISKPAVSRALDSLETKGYLTRQQDEVDRRAHRIRLSEKGLEIGPIVEKSYNQLYRLAMQGISQDELDGFLQLFARMSDNLTNLQKNSTHRDHDGT